MDNAKAPGADGSWLTPGRFTVLLSTLVVISFPGVILGTKTFVFRDYGLFSYPVAFFQRQCFWHGELPLWNPYSQCGLPFLAQWNTMCLYPPALLYLLLPLTWALAFFCLAHLVWGGLGMYLLARGWTGNRLAGGLAGVIFAFNGLNLNFLMWPSHGATFSWLPWILWLGPQALQQGGRKLAVATLAGALQMLAGGPETIMLTWVVLALLAFGEWVNARPVREGEGPQEASCRGFQGSEEGASNRVSRKQVALRFGAMVLLVGLLCAAQLLPFLELLSHSQRDTRYGSSSHNWEMPFWGWANFLVPLFRTGPTSQGVYLQNGQYWTSSYYAGIGTVLLAAVAVWRVRHWRVRLVAVLIFLGLVLAWGDTSMLFRGLQSCIPGLGLVRYPVKFVILVLALAPLMAAFGAAALASRDGKLGHFEWGCGCLIWLLISGISALERNAPTNLSRVTWHNGLSRAVFLLLILFLLSVGLRAGPQRGRRTALWSVLLLLVYWLDFRTHVPNQNPTASPAIYAHDLAGSARRWNSIPRLGESRAMLGAMARQTLSQNPLPDPGENFTRNRLAARGNANLLDGVPQIDCFFSLMPRIATTVTALVCSSDGRECSSQLDFLGVSQAITTGPTPNWVPRSTAMPLVTAGQLPVFADDFASLAALSNGNVDFRRTVILPVEAKREVKVSQESAAQVRLVGFRNQKVSLEVESASPCFVVCSQSYFPSWRAYVDSRAARLWRANYAFQAVEVAAGRHTVDFVYQDRAFSAGVVLSFVGVALWLVIILIPCKPQTPRAHQMI